MNNCLHDFTLCGTTEIPYWRNVGRINKGPWVKSFISNYYYSCIKCRHLKPVRTTSLALKHVEGDDPYEVSFGGNEPILSEFWIKEYFGAV